MAKQLWSIKYRPKTLDEYIFTDDSQLKLIEKWVEEQSIPHLFLKGHRGDRENVSGLLAEGFTGSGRCGLPKVECFGRE